MPAIYLDNSATTKPYSDVINKVRAIMEESYGNPSSLHSRGLEAEKIISAARRQVAAVLGLEKEEIIFTSGGTEANNLALIGASRRNRQRGKHVIVGSTEHPSVLEAALSLEQEGFRVSHIGVNAEGVIDPRQVEDEINESTILVSIMHVNNETGTIQSLAEIGRRIKEAKDSVLFHVDAVQSFTKLPLLLNQWRADMITGSGHKIHGPQGCGFLWIRQGTLINPIIFGGGQEQGLRSGTENVAAIAGLGLAAELSWKNHIDKAALMHKLKVTFYQKLAAAGIDININGQNPEKAAPHILNLSFPGIKAEVLLHALEKEGIFVSSGSACHSRHPEASHVLLAMDSSGKRAESALRFSFSIFNNEAEIIRAAEITAGKVKILNKLF